jgi:hypothetical protein
MALSLETTDSIQALRLDVCSEPGDSTIDDLRLIDSEGKLLIRWP